MRDFLNYWLANPSRATSGVVGLTFLSLFFPLVLPFGAAMVGLVALRHGPKASIEIIGYATLTLLIVSWVLGGNSAGILGLALSYWLPVGIAAGLWQQTGALAWVLLGLTLLAWGFIVLLYAVLTDPAAWWLDFLNHSRLANVPALNEWLQALRDLAPLFPGQAAVSLLILWLVSLTIARACLAQVRETPSFRAEFRELRLGKGVAALALLVFVSSLLLQLPFLINLSLVLLVIYLIQGLSLLHGVSYRRKWSPYFLMVIYLLLPIFSEPLIIFGVADAWADFRRRIPSRR